MSIVLLLLFLALTGCSTKDGENAAQRARSSQSEVAAGKIALVGGTVIDGTDKGPLKNATVVISGNRIEAVLPSGSDYKPDENREVIRVDGRFVLPGLFDTHVHYLGWAAPLYLANGITSITDCGNWTAWILAQKHAVASGLVPGPRIFAAAGQLDSPPGTYPHSINVATEEEARAVVRQHIRRGVDFIKAYTMLQPPLLKAIIEEAHAAGIPVRGHITVSAREAAEFGIDSLEHMSGIAIATVGDPEKLRELDQRRAESRFLPTTVTEWAAYMKPELFDDLIGLLVKQKTFVAPNLVSWWAGVHPHGKEYEQQDQAFLDDPMHAFIPQMSRSRIAGRHARNAASRSDPRFKLGYANTQKFIQLFIAAGGKVVAGSDATLLALHGMDLHRELELLVEAGLSPLQALQAATRNAAEMIRKDSEVGTLEPGKLADVVVVGADPLADIRNARKVELVIKDGKVLDTKYDPNFLDAIPRPLTKDYLRMLGIDPKDAM